MPGKKQVRLAFCDLAPDWDARDNYFTQALEHAGGRSRSAMGRRKSRILYSAGLLALTF